MNDYQQFLEAKTHRQKNFGKRIDGDQIHSSLFPFQKDIVKWAVEKGRCAVFLDTGLGKTRIQLEWARLIGEKTLIVAPLSVARQTVREAMAVDIDIQYVRDDSGIDSSSDIWITNYEMVDHFDLAEFRAVVLDESSILKSIGRGREQ